MQQEEYRCGIGFDVHKFIKGNFCIICGIKISHTSSLDGHSDADVGLHALTDALLGAIGCGDIGQYFPSEEQQWKDINSDKFVKHAVSLIEDRQGRIVNTDITLICESPKIRDYREMMKKNVSQYLNIEIERINIKATTTETLGFTGRKEGIAAYATVSIALPIM